jgi:hypothetical protein
MKVGAMPENLTEILRHELTQVEQRMQELEQRRQAILNLLRAYHSGRGAGTGRTAKLLSMPKAIQDHLSTLDMAQRVIEKRGPLKAEQIMEAIREEFAIKPAHTLPQMLYIRSRAKKRFYRSPDGKFGLIEKKKLVKRAAA